MIQTLCLEQGLEGKLGGGGEEGGDVEGLPLPQSALHTAAE